MNLVANVYIPGITCAVCVAVLFGDGGMANAAPGDTELISVTATSAEAAGDSYIFSPGNQSVSADGRFVVFIADAATLVPDDSGLALDVFVRDRQLRQTQRVSIAPNGAEANGGSSQPCISANGRFVAFTSSASNLVSGDLNNDGDVFLRDLQTGVTRRIAPHANNPALSADGRFVAYMSGGVFILDRATGVREPVSVAADGTMDTSGGAPSLSANGRYVAFQSNGNGQVFVRDRQQATTELISVGSSGAPGDRTSAQPSISADGRFVAFYSQAFNLVQGDTNLRSDIFVRDRTTRTTELVSRNSNGEIGNEISKTPAISGDGRYVAFWSQAYNLAPEGDNNSRGDIFVRDRQAETTERVNVSSTGEEANYPAASGHPSISTDGRFVTFESKAWNLVANDFNHDSYDVFLHERYVPNSGAASFTVSPIALTFGNQALYTNTTLSFWLSNKNNSSLPIASIGLVGLNSAMFSLNNGCGTSLAVGTSCRIRVTFRPTSVGDKSAQLRVVAGDNDVRTQAVAGKGVVSTFVVSPTSLDFGSVKVNTTTGPKVVTIRNSGSAALRVGSISLSGWNPNQFAKSHNCPARLAVGASCTINVAFKPTATGSKAALIDITPGGGAAIRSVALTGAAIR